jgi:NitT/TauT family transport system permease protein
MARAFQQYRHARSFDGFGHSMSSVALEREPKGTALRSATTQFYGRHVRLAGFACWFISFVALMLFWEWIVIYLDVPPVVLPRPTAIMQALWLDIADGTTLRDFGTTLTEVVLGFTFGSTIGFSLALLIGEFKWARWTIYPYIVGLQSIPKIAIAPLVLVWFGFGIEPKVILICIASAFPVLVNTVAGLDRIPSEQLDLMRAFCARRWQLFLRVKLPSCLPMTFAGLELAMVYSLLSAVIAEFLGADSGLGYRIMFYNTRLEMAPQFGALIALATLGFFLSLFVRKVGRTLIFWDKGQR